MKWFACIPLLLQHFMYQVTSRGLVACTMSVSMLWICGEMALDATIVSLSAQIQLQKECVCETSIFIQTWRNHIPLCTCALVLTCQWLPWQRHWNVGSRTGLWQRWSTLYGCHSPWRHLLCSTPYTCVQRWVCPNSSFIYTDPWCFPCFLCQQIHWSPCIWDCLLILTGRTSS